MVASSQPLANAAGISILNQGGNAIDACIAMSAALCVTEPPSTGVGGDAFLLYYDNKSQEIYGLNACGRSPSKLSWEWIRKNTDISSKRMPFDSIHALTVPGAIAGWCDAVDKWGSGKVTMAQILEPAISLAENGFVVSSIAAQLWNRCCEKLISKSGENANVFLNEDGSFPEPGQVFINELVAKVFRKVATEGKQGFYSGDIAQEIVNAVQSRGGLLNLEDLSSHHSEVVKPICIEFCGKYIWEIPPNGQGLVVLLTLGYIKSLAKRGVIQLGKLQHNSVEYLHLVTECLKLAFFESEKYITDLNHHPEIQLSEALSEERLEHVSQFIKLDSLLTREDFGNVTVPNPIYDSDTVYLTAVDKDGNACSFINSVYIEFGSGIIPNKYGFSLQNRGAAFNLTPGAPNCLAPNKRPFHTIIPSMITEFDSEGKHRLWASMGCMGAAMQPQGHVQIFLNMVLFGMDPQEAIDCPRISLNSNNKLRHLDIGLGSDGPNATPEPKLVIEETMPDDVIDGLRKMGHNVSVAKGYHRDIFGRAQCIRNLSKNGRVIWAGGSDPRGDGAAVPQI
ncbi:uncharacterized protein J8A68_003516 [[Candida] subhashii]|uniref:Gamma-glutamyltransferase n=1 Tax=[Candida] subhashii TaxID=561895 RepID=A0A8J5QLV3_9ASCO|nr:uncharacterized protein J8A68_003516 [[Candida] subhashii]KAG7662966.1 hypothetical protein J8A68_003516 [[Candida] subhashii]